MINRREQIQIYRSFARSRYEYDIYESRFQTVIFRPSKQNVNPLLKSCFWYKCNQTGPGEVSICHTFVCRCPISKRHLGAVIKWLLCLNRYPYLIPIAVSSTASAVFKAFEISASATMPPSSNFFPASSIVTNASFTTFADITVRVSKRDAWA